MLTEYGGAVLVAQAAHDRNMLLNEMIYMPLATKILRAIYFLFGRGSHVDMSKITSVKMSARNERKWL